MDEPVRIQVRNPRTRKIHIVEIAQSDYANLILGQPLPADIAARSIDGHEVGGYIWNGYVWTRRQDEPETI